MISGLQGLIRLSFFFVLITASCVSFRPGLARAASHGWVAFGDLRGSLEPCGCDPSTDLGGIKRMITAVGRERILKPNLGVFCLGNSLGPIGENEIKNKFLLNGLSLVKPAATLFNGLELSSRHWLEQVYANDSKVITSQNFVLSNLKKGGHRPWIANLVRTDDYLVFGYLFDPQLVEDVERFSESLLIRWQKGIGGSNAGKKKVLLFSGPSADLDRLKKADFFDVIISSHSAPHSELPSTKDKDDEFRLARNRNGDGAMVWMVPLAGQGYLRGGDLQNREGASLEQVFSQTNSATKLGDGSGSLTVGSVFSQPKVVSWLLPEVGENKAAQQLYGEYMRETKRAFALAAAARAKDLSASPYAGAEACTACHSAEVEKFKRTKHYHAMGTLLRKGKDQDPDCVVCHAVGAKIKGGFVSLQDSPSLAGVQCENCHGPRKDHTRNPMAPAKNKTDPFKACPECHNSQHSPKFKLAEYWLMIEHGRGHEVKTQGKSDP